MRKRLRLLLLLAAAMALLSIPAFADDTITSTTPAGIYNVTSTNEHISFVAQTASGTEVASIQNQKLTVGTTEVTATNYYPGAEKLAVTYNAAIDKSYYLILAQNEQAAPTANNIVYIDQTTASGTSTSFTVYPSSLVSGTTYSVYLASNDGTLSYSATSPLLTFSYYAPYTLGDVNEDNLFTATDASCALQMAVGKGTWTSNQLLAANVNKDSLITATDAMLILSRAVGKISSFD